MCGGMRIRKVRSQCGAAVASKDPRWQSFVLYLSVRTKPQLYNQDQDAYTKSEVL